MAAVFASPRRRRLLRWVLALTLAGLLGYVAVALISGFADGASAIADADPGWLLVAVAVEAVALPPPHRPAAAPHRARTSSSGGAAPSASP